MDDGEPPMPGVEITLTVYYPNGDIVEVVAVTDEQGYYSFDNLLLDEDYEEILGFARPGRGVFLGLRGRFSR